MIVLEGWEREGGKDKYREGSVRRYDRTLISRVYIGKRVEMIPLYLCQRSSISNTAGPEDTAGLLRELGI